MIDEMQVKNLALIKQASLVPAQGLTVLTGETGAGKTALLSALKLLMGSRADKDSVRDGQDGLEVSGRFFGLSRASSDGDEPREDEDELVAVRRVGADGRSRVTLDGRMASVRELAGTVSPSIDLCGQHDQQQLLKPAAHVGMLDAWAGQSVAEALHAYQGAFAEASRAAAELARVRDAGAASSAKLDEARFVLQRIDAVDPREGEYEELSAKLARAEHAETLAMSAYRAHQALGGDEGAIDLLGSAAAALDEGSRYDPELGKLAESLREAGYVLEDVSRTARDYRDGVEFDPEELERGQERMAALQGLMRTYGPRMADVLAARDEAADLVSLVDDAEERERVASGRCRRTGIGGGGADPRRCARRSCAKVLPGGVGADAAVGDGHGAARVRAACAAARIVDPLRCVGGGVHVPARRRHAGPPACPHSLGRRGQPRHAGHKGGARAGRQR